MSDIKKQDLIDIKNSLRYDYSEEEVDSMLLTASFNYFDGGIEITYLNGVKDKFYYKKVLVHSSEFKKEN